MEVMDIKHIEQLLESFYDGITSVEEEKVLFGFFTGNGVPDYMEKERKLFLKLYQTEKTSIPENLEFRLNSLIDTLESANSGDEKRNKISVSHWQWIGGIAASIILFASAGLLLHKNFDKKSDFVMQDTYTNPEEAYRETQKAMLLVSNKLNKGLEQMETVQDNVEKVNRVMNKKNIRL